jgi:hypothetical protein
MHQIAASYADNNTWSLASYRMSAAPAHEAQSPPLMNAISAMHENSRTAWLAKRLGNIDYFTNAANTCQNARQNAMKYLGAAPCHGTKFHFSYSQTLYRYATEHRLMDTLDLLIRCIDDWFIDISSLNYLIEINWYIKMINNTSL